MVCCNICLLLDLCMADLFCHAATTKPELNPSLSIGFHQYVHIRRRNLRKGQKLDMVVKDDGIHIPLNQRIDIKKIKEFDNV